VGDEGRGGEKRGEMTQKLYAQNCMNKIKNTKIHSLYPQSTL
jgi:hypothetical protein